MDAQLRIKSTGFAVLDRDTGQAVSVEWADVREIVAFKRDLITFDEICLAFRHRDAERWIEISESDDGFAQILTRVKQNFPSIPDDWYPEVMFPPIETCAGAVPRRCLTRSSEAAQKRPPDRRTLGIPEPTT